jgi:hypothetical protein
LLISLNARIVSTLKHFEDGRLIACAQEACAMTRRTSSLLTALTLVLLSTTPYVAMADIKRLSAIPEVFWGAWATSTDDCRNADKSYVVLSATTYVNSDLNCAVDWVSETAGARGSIYSARLRCAKPGSPPTTSNVIFRRNDTDHILSGPNFAGLKTYGRCRSTEPVSTK